MTSIRRRLLTALLVGLTPTTALGGIALYLSVRHALLRAFDRSLEQQVRAMAQSVRTEAGRVDMDFAGETTPEFENVRGGDYYILRLADGSEVERSVSLRGGSLGALPPLSDSPEFWDLALPDGRRGRAVGLGFTAHVDPEDEKERPPDPAASLGGAPPQGRPVSLVVAHGREDVDMSLSALLGGMGVCGAVLVGGISLVLWRSVRSGLRPLHRFAAEVAAIDAEALSSRVDGSAAPAEVRPIAGAMNAMLSRLERAFERERRFTACAAHELRTPLAELRTLTEVALRWPEGSTDAKRTIEQAHQIGLGMEATVRALLALSRAQSGREQVQVEDVRVSSILEAAVERHRPFAARRGLTLRVDVRGDTIARGDPAMIASIADNLLGNAAEHADPGGEVDVSCLTRDRRVAIRVRNRAERLSAEEAKRMFEPFWTGDASGSNGRGLGLPLVAALAECQGGDAGAEVEPGGELTVWARIPSAEEG